MNTNIKLKDIFTIQNQDKLFSLNPTFWNKFDPDHLQFFKDSLESFRNCRNPNFAKVIFSCYQCNFKAYRPVPCKSRFCPSCGIKYAEKWAQGTMNSLIDVPHRAVIFSMPKELWNLCIHNRNILKDFSDAINEIFSYQFNKDKIIDFGLIINIHTFARDSSFNTHFHLLLTDGGFTNKGKFKPKYYFSFKGFRISWRKKVMDIIKKYHSNRPDIKTLISNCYKKEFTVCLQGQKIVNDLKSIKYFGRYLARPAIAEYRIIGFDGHNVTYWYNDLKTGSKKTVTLDVLTFMGRLVQQIPPKGFKMVRRYGIYARRIRDFLKGILNRFKRKKLFATTSIPWNEQIKKITGTDPLICPRCNIPMGISKIIHKKYGIYLYE